MPGALVDLAETIVIKEQNVFAVSQRDGSIPTGTAHPLGIYADDCRFVSGHELRVGGVRPRLLVASAAPGSESVHELTNPALPLPGGRLLPPQTLQIRLERRVSGECEIEETVLVHSHDREPLQLQLDLQLEADFEPMLAIRGIVATAGAGRVDRRARASTACASHRGARRAPPGTTVAADRPCRRRRATRRAALPALAAARRIRDDHAALRAPRRRRAAARAEPAARGAPAPAALPTRGCGAHDRRDRRRALQPRAAPLAARRADAALAPAAPTATTQPACPGTRRCSGATR